MSNRKEKKSHFEEKANRSSKVWLALALIVLAVAGAGSWIAFGGSAGGYPRVEGSQGKIAIPLAEVDDGRAHFYSYRHGEGTVKFFVLKSGDGVVRAALDTCDVCFREQKGYRQEGDFMVCNNCNQKFRSDLINEVKGGCNPAPLERVVADGKIVIAEADLVRGARYFPGAGG